MWNILGVYMYMFAMVFMAEYGTIIFFSYLMVGMFTSLILSWLSWFFINLMVFLIILMRGVLPRMRYDDLMYLCWKIILPFILNYLIFVMMYKFLYVMMF